jgi:hypothetical protein
MFRVGGRNIIDIQVEEIPKLGNIEGLNFLEEELRVNYKKMEGCCP